MGHHDNMGERCFECGYEWVPGPDKCPKCLEKPKGREGFDYCTHDAETDYCDGCLYIRQIAAGQIAVRVKLAIEQLDTLLKDEPAYPTIPRADLERVRATLTGEEE